MLDALEPPWPDVFSLMWDAYVARTIPVGAVVVDPPGAIVAVVTLYRSTRPRLVEAARHLPPPDSGATLDDAYTALESLNP